MTWLEWLMVLGASLWVGCVFYCAYLLAKLGNDAGPLQPETDDERFERQQREAAMLGMLTVCM